LPVYFIPRNPGGGASGPGNGGAPIGGGVSLPVYYFPNPVGGGESPPVGGSAPGAGTGSAPGGLEEGGFAFLQDTEVAPAPVPAPILLLLFGLALLGRWIRPRTC